MLSNQEIFDLVAQHLLTQRTPSRTIGGVACAYRGVGGLKCAVGCLIPDEVYCLEMEGSIARLVRSFPVAMLTAGLNVRQPHVVRLLVALQHIHDGLAPDRWGVALRTLAKTSTLDTKNLDDIIETTAC